LLTFDLDHYINGLLGEILDVFAGQRSSGPPVSGVSGRIASRLTGDLLVTYYPAMLNEDQIFKALADPTRRLLLDLLHQRDGQTLGELEAPLAMSRFGVMKHLRILESAGLVVTRRAGREKHHFLNAVPIRLIHDRWIDKYTEHHVAALADLKATLENTKWKSARKRA
jgi:DNA-binding transcriptional ArsR family regulator